MKIEEGQRLIFVRFGLGSRPIEVVVRKVYKTGRFVVDGEGVDPKKQWVPGFQDWAPMMNNPERVALAPSCRPAGGWSQARLFHTGFKKVFEWVALS